MPAADGDGAGAPGGGAGRSRRRRSGGRCRSAVPARHAGGRRAPSAPHPLHRTRSPSVVFESGLGGTSLDWARVQPEVARFTRACSYDRAGYGWSERGPEPRHADRIAAELDRLLLHANVPPPYVLVGHSFGGLAARLLAARKERRAVAGLVLVDATHEHQFQRMESAGIRIPMAPTGRRFVIANHGLVPDALPDRLKPLAQRLASARKSIRTLYEELGSLRHSARQVGAIRRLPDAPVIVLAADRVPTPTPITIVAIECGTICSAIFRGEWKTVRFRWFTARATTSISNARRGSSARFVRSSTDSGSHRRLRPLVTGPPRAGTDAGGIDPMRGGVRPNCGVPGIEGVPPSRTRARCPRSRELPGLETRDRYSRDRHALVVDIRTLRIAGYRSARLSLPRRRQGVCDRSTDSRHRPAAMSRYASSMARALARRRLTRP